MATWFVSVKSLNFQNSNDLLDWLEANAQVHFVHTASQSPERRLNVMLAVFRSDCAAGNIPTTFGVPQPLLAVRALQGDDEPTHIEKLFAKPLTSCVPLPITVMVEFANAIFAILISIVFGVVVRDILSSSVQRPRQIRRPKLRATSRLPTGSLRLFAVLRPRDYQPGA